MHSHRDEEDEWDIVKIPKSSFPFDLMIVPDQASSRLVRTTFGMIKLRSQEPFYPLDPREFLHTPRHLRVRFSLMVIPVKAQKNRFNHRWERLFFWKEIFSLFHQESGA